ncbi:MAG TPA: hypothetical protein VIF15_21450 [Polyangiaceae bacterium]
MLTRALDPSRQAATGSGLPVLLRTSGKTGHGLDSPLDERIDQAADVYSFLAEQLGMNEHVRRNATR